MRPVSAAVLVSALTLGLSACSPPEDTGDGPGLAGPVVTHTPPEGPLVEGDSVDLVALAEDPDGVAGLRLYTRTQGSETWAWADMAQTGEGWTSRVEVEDPGLEYYFKAADDGEPQAVSYLPEAAGAEPFALPVLVQALALPFFEGFELDEGEDRVEDLGWATCESAFPGYPWSLTEGGSEGALRVRHALGTSDPEDLMDDWLITPALDFSSLDRVGLSWYQQGTSPELADHGLYLSTTSRDPADGGFELVQALEPPSEAWARSEPVDLSAWAGERVVYLAWRYLGADADTWSVDAVSVGALEPDFQVSVASSPEPVHPGDEVTLEVTVANGVDIEAPDVALALHVDMGASTVDQEQALGTIAGLGEAGTSFSFTLDPGLPDNSLLPCAFTVSSGGIEWSQDWQLQLGHPSRATFALDLDSAALVQVSLGVGDPDAPTWEEAVLNASLEAGSASFEVDVTGQNELLPPEPGAHRWYARVLSYASGGVDGFALSWGGGTYEATVLPALTAGEETVVWLPEPPAPVLANSRTDPQTVQPGDGVSFALLQLRNDGAASADQVWATLESGDPDVTVLDPGPLAVGAGAWAEGASTVLSDAFAFEVSGGHVDSQDLSLTLVLDDGVDRFELPLSVPVPWPVLRIVRVDVDDAEGGDGDGVLDPGESASLELTVANAGGQATDGIARGTLALLPSSTASASLDADSHSFGQIDPGDTRSEDFAIAVQGGAAGDTLDLQLDLYDARATFALVLQIVLGEPAWLASSAVDDPTGDALDGYGFDFVNAWYRVEGGLFQLRLESATPFDPGTVFVEGWGNSSGAGYVLYQLVVQGGAADLLGWPDYSSHTPIASPSLSVPGATELLLEWDPAAMDLALDSFSMGFAAGWCGPPEYYCDQFPDGWGYPYEGYDSGAWLDFEW